MPLRHKENKKTNNKLQCLRLISAGSAQAAQSPEHPLTERSRRQQLKVK